MEIKSETTSNSPHSNELLPAFLGVCFILVAVLMLIDCREKKDCAGKRTVALLMLLLGELLLFPWHSLIDAVKISIVATVNFVLGANKDMLDGATGWLKKFPAQYAAWHSENLSKQEHTTDQEEGAGVQTQHCDGQENQKLRATNQFRLSILTILCRMIWPDQPFK